MFFALGCWLSVSGQSNSYFSVYVIGTKSLREKSEHSACQDFRKSSDFRERPASDIIIIPPPNKKHLLSGNLNSSRQNLLPHPIPTPPSPSFNFRWQAHEHLQQLVGRIGRLQHLPRSPILIGKIRVHSARM